jgi:hypothetical protein
VSGILAVAVSALLKNADERVTDSVVLEVYIAALSTGR